MLEIKRPHRVRSPPSTIFEVGPRRVRFCRLSRAPERATSANCRHSFGSVSMSAHRPSVDVAVQVTSEKYGSGAPGASLLSTSTPRPVALDDFISKGCPVERHGCLGDMPALQRQTHDSDAGACARASHRGRAPMGTCRSSRARSRVPSLTGPPVTVTYLPQDAVHLKIIGPE